MNSNHRSTMAVVDSIRETIFAMTAMAISNSLVVVASIELSRTISKMMISVVIVVVIVL